MPYKIARKNCTKSDGTKGTYVLINTDTQREVACCVDKADAETTKRIRDEAHAAKMKG